jgi:hypothetical protein
MQIIHSIGKLGLGEFILQYPINMLVGVIEFENELNNRMLKQAGDEPLSLGDLRNKKGW